MKMIIARFLATSLLVTVVACDDKKAKVVPEHNPSAPVAVTRGDAWVTEGTPVALDGAGSTDPDGDIATYAWEQTGGPSVTLGSAGSAVATFTAPEVADTAFLHFRLTVTDSGGLSSTASMSVTVADLNIRPTANAGADQQVDALQTVTLTGTGTDADGSSVSYLWEHEAGPQITLMTSDQSTATFDAPDVNQPHDIVVKLSVTDDEGKIATDFITISVAPVADSLAFVLASVPASALRNAVWSPVQVEVRNAAGVRITGGMPSDYEITIAVQASTGAATGTLNGIVTNLAYGGVAVFDDLSYDMVTPTDNGAVIEATVTTPALAATPSDPVEITWPTQLPGGIFATGNLDIRAIGLFKNGAVDDMLVAGSFDSGGTPVQFDMTGTATAISSTGVDGFLARYDGVDGSLVWVKTFSNAGTVVVTDVTTNIGGDIFVSVTFDNTDLDFATDPAGTGTPITATLTPIGGIDAAVAKLDADGWAQWVDVFGGPNDDAINAVSLTSTNGVVVAGSFRGIDVDFDPAAGSSALSSSTSASTTDTFLLSLDATGAYVWHETYGTTGNDVATDVVVRRSNDDVYFVGSTDARTNAFVSRRISDGTEQWTHTFGGDGGLNRADSVDVDAFGNVYLAGTFLGTGDFDPDATAVSTLSDGGGLNLFVSSFTATGALRFTGAIGSADEVTVGDLAFRDGGTDSVIIVGNFTNTADFDPTTTQHSVTGVAGQATSYVVSITSDGAFEWVGTGDSDRVTYGTAVAATSNAIWMAGGIDGAGTSDLDPQASTVEFASSAGISGFFVKMNGLGSVIP